MAQSTFATYSLSQVRPPWLHALYGYGGPQSGKQQRFLTPPEQPEFAHHHLRMLDAVLGRTECAGRFSLTFADLSRRTPGACAGRGCVAIVLTSRVEHGIDSVGRGSPTFKHALIAADRALDRYSLQAAAFALAHSAVGIEAAGKSRGHELYLRYIEALSAGSSTEQAAAEFLIPYLQSSVPWSAPPRTPGGQRFLLPKQEVGLIHITHRRTQDIVDLIVPAAQLAAILYNAAPGDGSDGQVYGWVAVEIGTTRYLPEKDGLTIRFLPEDEQVDSESPCVTLKLEDLPELADDASYPLELARAVFQRGSEVVQENPRAASAPGSRDKARPGEPPSTIGTTERSGPSELRTEVNPSDSPQRGKQRSPLELPFAGEDSDRQTRPMPVFIPPLLVPQPLLTRRRSLRPLFFGGVAGWGLILLLSALKNLFLPPPVPVPVASVGAPPRPEVRCEIQGSPLPAPIEAVPAASGATGKLEGKSESRKGRPESRERRSEAAGIRETRTEPRSLLRPVSEPAAAPPPSEASSAPRTSNQEGQFDRLNASLGQAGSSGPPPPR